MKPTEPNQSENLQEPAAFRRLCVETVSGGWCVAQIEPAAFRRLCVETKYRQYHGEYRAQPPSGGCVLKHFKHLLPRLNAGPAAFRRLCVETRSTFLDFVPVVPAAFRRLCVETMYDGYVEAGQQPAAFRRLCVETHVKSRWYYVIIASRLQAAVC